MAISNYKKNIVNPPDHIPDKYKNKKYYIVKKNVSKHEATIQRLLCTHTDVPKVYYYHEESSFIVMRRIPKLCLADEYGEHYDDLPDRIKTLLYEKMCLLFYNHFIYNDFTGYNFIYYQNKLWIIDFEHCNYDTDPSGSFMKDFVEGNVTGWNPEFI
jgi:tRNA A-37 threonylcarbamoyl transferase component Bud32